jgi:hypothetical protein
VISERVFPDSLGVGISGVARMWSTVRTPEGSVPFPASDLARLLGVGPRPAVIPPQTRLKSPEPYTPRRDDCGVRSWLLVKKCGEVQ